MIESINDFYIENGFIYSYVADLNIHEDVIKIRVIEGHIRDIIIDDDFRNKYVDYYIEQIKTIRPFNWNQADRYFALLKTSPGFVDKMRMDTIILSPLKSIDPKNPATVDLVIENKFYKYDGLIALDNRHKPSIDINDKGLRDGYTYVRHRDSNFIQANFNINNPFALGGKLSTNIISSGDKEDNSGSVKYKQPINLQGTKLVLKLGGSSTPINDRQKLQFADIGIEHPLYLSAKHKLDVRCDFYTYRNYKSKQEMKNLKKNKLTANKAIFGSTYNFKDSYGFNHFIEVSYHYGMGVKSNRATFDHKEKFSKWIFNLGSSHPFFCENCKLNLSVNAQHSKDKLISAELFSVGVYRGGRGFYGGEIYGDSGITGSVELSKTNFLQESNFIISHREYVYIDTGMTKNRKKNARRVKSAKLMSAGIGSEILVIDNLVFSIEYSKPLLKKINNIVKKENNTKSRIFLGLEYFFAF